MSKIEEIASAVERGKAKLVPGLVEEALDEAGYEGIKYSVFAYAGSNMPPKKTAPARANAATPDSLSIRVFLACSS